MSIFNIAEVVDMGIEKEKKRRDFYARAAENFRDNQRLGELFLKLRDWEEEHIRKFSDLRENIKEEPFESYPGELSKYIQTLVDDKLYQEVTAGYFAENVTTPTEALNYGISFEKDAILFFRELQPYVGAKANEAIRTLIDEEKKHLVFLSELKKKLKD